MRLIRTVSRFFSIFALTVFISSAGSSYGDSHECCCCEFDLSLNCECLHENDTEDQIPSYALSVILKKVLDLDRSFKLLRVVPFYNDPPLLLSDHNKEFYICSKNYATRSVVFLI